MKNLKLKLILPLLFFLPVTLFAQKVLKGKIVDKKDGAPLAFVNVINGSGHGTISDIDGNFSIKWMEGQALIFTYVGYLPDTIIPVGNEKSLLIRLSRKQINLDEVVIKPGENPAHRIIGIAIQNRDLNNPENYTGFSYTSYNKMIFTGDKSVNTFAITTDEQKNEIARVDSFLEKQHLFLMESVTKRYYRGPGRDVERVLASRISGLKNPSFQLLANELQSFSFYGKNISISGSDYVNPISPGALNHYLFVLEDTILKNPDTVFVISYRPATGKNFKGLSGLLYINTDRFAIQNVIAQPADTSESMQIKIQQKYERISNQWFPVQLNTDLNFKNISVGPFAITGIARSYLDSIIIGEEAETVRFSEVVVVADPEANKQENEFWNRYRTDTLSQKEITTYHVIDSIGKKAKLDRKLQLIESLQTGELPMGKVNLQLNRVLDYNEYEGFRLGAGLKTNRRLSSFFSLEGYAGYGFRDNAVKYGGGLNITPFRLSDFRLNAFYSQDIRESGSVYFESRQGTFSTESYRDYHVHKFDSIKRIAGSIRFRVARYLLSSLFLSREEVNAIGNYRYSILKEGTSFGIDQYSAFLAGGELRFAFREKFIQTTHSRISTGSKYPILYLRVEKSLPDYETGFDFTRVTGRVDSRYNLSYLGKGKLTAIAGTVTGATPYTWLFAPPANTLNVTLDAENTFQVMRLNEFVNSKFIYAFYSHNFGSLLINKGSFKPQIVLVQNIGIGEMQDQNLHSGRTNVGMEKGYYESGLRLENLFVSSIVGIGVSGYFRYGPYSFPKTEDNISLKITVGFQL